MKIHIITTKNCVACVKVKESFDTLKIPYTSEGITQEYIDAHPYEMSKYKSWPHVWDYDREENNGFWFSGAPPVNIISKVLNRKQPKNIERRRK